MNRLVRNRFAVGAVGVLAFSLAATPLLASADQNPITADDTDVSIVTAGSYVGRISGEDRFGTAVAASKNLTAAQVDTDAGVTDYVILANYMAWSDTLTATPLADVVDAPVLYTRADGLEAQTRAELQRLRGLDVDRALLVGGEGVISPAVAAQLDSMGFDVDRLGGDDRYETGLLLAAEAVDHYEGNGEDLYPLREAIRALDAAEADYQAARVAWEVSRDASAAAFDSVLAAQDALNAANEALADLLDGIVEIPGVTWTNPVTGVTLEITDLETYNELVVEQNEAIEDATAVEAWVQELVSEFVDFYGSDFQDAVWNDDVVPFFGTRVLSITLNSGTYTGTLEALSTTVPYLTAAVASEGEETTVRAVDIFLRDAVEDEEAAAEDLRSNYASIVAQIIDRIDAIEANEQLFRDIRNAQRLVEQREVQLEAAVDAYFDAREAEAEAKADFEAATADRPTGDAWAHAELVLENELQRVIRAGRAFPGFYATGLDFADALASGPAAAAEAGVVLLTRGTEVPPATQRYLDNGSNVVAVGGPAAAAVDAEEEYIGIDRYETATLLATAYFDSPDYVALASGVVAADAVVGGAFIANVDGTLVLTRPDSLPEVTSTFLSYRVDQPWLIIFGGPGAVSNDVRNDALEALTN